MGKYTSFPGQSICTGRVLTGFDTARSGAIIIALWRSWGDGISFRPEAPGFATYGSRVLLIPFHCQNVLNFPFWSAHAILATTKSSMTTGSFHIAI